ncbi:MAG: exo-alpha-sialidase [Burkholderiales bacterium]|nr:exo-alpha-sialidase [Burkholderiales bacterium]
MAEIRIKRFYALLLFSVLFILFSIICVLNSQTVPLPRGFLVPIINHEVIDLQGSFLFESTLIPQPKYLLASHSSTLEVLPDSSLIALWFAGSGEGKPDVNIWQSFYRDGKWTEAVAVITRKSIENNTRMFIKKVGNPVVYRGLNNVLHLFVVSVGVGGWSGSSINHLISYDNGARWGLARKLILSPVFNISTLIRTAGITLSDGGFYLPVYFEAGSTYSELLYFTQDGNLVKQLRLNYANHLIQPSMVAISEESAFIYFRNHTVNNSTLLMQNTVNGGKTWSEVKPTNLSNQDSSIATANLGDGRVLMVHNQGNGRGKLILSVSDNGVQWRTLYILESGRNNSEFSYPSIQVHGNIVDVLYTWQRKAIKHVRFDLAWLNRQDSYSDGQKHD